MGSNVRDGIKNVLLVLLTTAMATASNKKPFTATIIGAGRVGGYHTKGQLALGSKVIIYEPNAERAQIFTEQFEHKVSIAQTIEEAISAADVVHICTPPMYHLKTALISIAHGKPTIIEKPLAFKLEEAIEIYKATLKPDGPPVILATSFRIGPSPSGIYEGVANGGIGEIESLETSYVHDTKNLEAGATWRKRLEDTAFLYEGGTHAVDLNMWLANQAVIELQASVSRKKTRLEYRWDEDFAINLKYADGTVGRVWVNASAPLPRHGSEIAVYGATGAGRTARNIIMIRIRR
jgi:predicted dehydrogenase